MHHRQHALIGLFLFSVAAGCGAPEASLVISSPSSGPVHVRDTLTLQVAVFEADVEQVELLRNGELLAVLHPPFQYTWDTRAEPEGLASLVAEARHGEVLLSSEPLEVVVDRSAPRVVSSAPAAWSENAWLLEPIRLALSEPIDPASIHGPAFFTDGLSAILAEATLSPDGTELSVRASVPPRAGATWTLEFEGLRDLAGNPLSTPGLSWNLPRWQRPSARMDTDGLYATGTHSPSMKLDARGAPVVAFVEHHRPYASCCGRMDSRVHVQRWNGASWVALGEQLNAYGDDPLEPPESGARYTAAHSPSLVLDADGQPIVAWLERTAPHPNVIEEIHVSRWNGASWDPLGGPVGALPGETSASPPRLALTPEGVPVVAFVEAINPDLSQIQVRRWSGAGWETLGAPLGTDWTGKIRTSIAMDVGPEGTIAVAWAQKLNSSGLPSAEERLRVAIWQDSGWYLRQYNEDSAAGTPVGSPYLRVDHQGQAVVAWNERGAGGYSSYVMISGRHGAAAHTHLVSGRGDASTSVVGLTIDSRGRLLVAWSHESGVRASLERWSGDGWTTLDDDLGSLHGGPFSVQDLAVASNGVVAAALQSLQPEYTAEVVRSSF